MRPPAVVSNSRPAAWGAGITGQGATYYCTGALKRWNGPPRGCLPAACEELIPFVAYMTIWVGLIKTMMHWPGVEHRFQISNARSYRSSMGSRCI